MKGQSAVFRVDASLQIGTGHVMRCLTLANGMAERGVRSTFLCRNHDGQMSDIIRQNGHDVHLLDRVKAPKSDGRTAHSEWLGVTGQTDAEECRDIIAHRTPDCLVIDHYALDAAWRHALRLDIPVLAIDDLADRPIDADILLDQNLGRSASDYDALVQPDTLRLIGPQFALLRPEFARSRPESLERRGDQLERVLVALGGVDQDNATAPILQALSELKMDVDVVLGPTAPHAKDVATLAERTGAILHLGSNSMAELMRDVDLAIGGAGTTSWERCALGLPTIVLVMAENQRASATALETEGAVCVIDDPDQVIAALHQLKVPGRLRRMSDRAARVTDGNGLSRVLDHMETGIHGG